MREHLYKLDGKTPVPCGVLIWGKWFETADRIVAKTEINSEVLLSTVFLGIDHNFLLDEDLPPILFESLVMGGENDGEIWRYETWEDAEEGHAMLEKILREGRNPLGVRDSREKDVIKLPEGPGVTSKVRVIRFRRKRS